MAHAKYKQTTEKRRNERSEHDLIAAIFHEIADHPWPELRGDKLQRQHGDRKDQTGDYDHQTCNRRKGRAGAFRS